MDKNRLKVFTKILVIFLLLISSLALLWYFYKGTRKTTYPEEFLQKDPETATMEFYKWYINFKGRPLKTGAYKNISLLTDNYKNNLANINMDNMLYDPILCSVDKPYKYKVSGLSIDESGNSAVVTIEEDYYGTPVKTEASLVKSGNIWQVDGITCVAGRSPETNNPENQVIIYFLNFSKQPDKTHECGVVYGVARKLDLADLGVDKDYGTLDSQTRYTEILRLLFEGLTSPEKAQGYSTSLKPENFLGFKLVGNVAYVNLSSNLKNSIDNSSCNIINLTAQIEETLKHGREINKVIYAFDGDPVAFYEWSQIGCQTVDGVNYCEKIGW